MTNIREKTFEMFTREQKALYNNIGTELMCGIENPIEIAEVLELLAIEMRVDGNGKCR
ncbi:MAG: hypothetical protein WC433_08345 [Candidatus Omnitrophota bacterium]